jgi:hypothetical protein
VGQHDYDGGFLREGRVESAARDARLLLKCGFSFLALALAGCALGESARMSRPAYYVAGRAFLVGAEPEERGYGLYSYVLFGGPPTTATREAYQQAVASYLEYLPPVESLEANVNRDHLNVTYMPVTVPPPANVADFRPKLDDAGERAAASAWVLEHYDYARAQLLLAAVGRGHGDGPYLVSSLRPLSNTEPPPGGVLRQDLSGTPPEFMRSWLHEFLAQAASPADWNATSLSQFVLRLRTAAVSIASAWPDVRDSVRQLIGDVQ